jgi:large subunit ribosomal protein L23
MYSDQKTSIDLIKYPLLTEKSITLIEQNQYSFAVDYRATKTSVKNAIENLFDVKVISVNTSRQAIKMRRVGKYIGQKSQHKKAIVTLAPENSITLFKDV